MDSVRNPREAKGMMKTQSIGITIADRHWDGTIERAIALVLDHHLIGAGEAHGKPRFVLRDGDAALIEALVRAVAADDDYRPGSLVRIRSEWNGEREPVHVVIEWNGDRGVIAPLAWPHGTIRPQEAVSAEMIESAFPRPELRKSRSHGARPTEQEGDQDHA